MVGSFHCKGTLESGKHIEIAGAGLGAGAEVYKIVAKVADLKTLLVLCTGCTKTCAYLVNFE